MSRAMADGMAKTVGVISEPAVVLQGVERSVKYWAVVASDGLWQYISIEQLQQKVETYLLVLSKQSEQGMFCSQMSELLVKWAKDSWGTNQGDHYHDDITIIFIILDPQQ